VGQHRTHALEQHQPGPSQCQFRMVDTEGAATLAGATAPAAFRRTSARDLLGKPPMRVEQPSQVIDQQPTWHTVDADKGRMAAYDLGGGLPEPTI
jgi:hypothetical protein